MAHSLRPKPPRALALMLEVAGRGIGHSLRSANISFQQEGIHHRTYLSIGVTSFSGMGLCGMSGGVISWGNGVWLCRIVHVNFREFFECELRRTPKSGSPTSENFQNANFALTEFSEVRRFFGALTCFVPWSTYTILRQAYAAFVTWPAVAA
jgi:hypothetical protein